MQKLKLITALLILIFLILSCSPPNLSDNTRILVKGKITDRNDNPIVGSTINVYTISGSSSCFFCPSNTSNFLLGSNESLEDGSFAVTSVLDRTPRFYISIENQTSFAEYIYVTDTSAPLPETLIYDLGAIELQTLAKVNYEIERITLDGTQLNFSFTYQFPSCSEFYDEGVLNQEQSQCYETVDFSRNLSNENPNLSGSFSTVLGSTVNFVYSINGGSEISETFVINQENFEFNFTY